MKQDEPNAAQPATGLSTKNLLRGLLIAVVIGAIVMAFVFGGTGSQGLSAIGSVRVAPLALALLAAVFSWALTASSLIFLSVPAGTVRPLRQVLPAFMAGNFCGLVTPFGSGGTPGQAYFLSRLDIPGGTALALAVSRGIISGTLVAVSTALALVFGRSWLPSGIAGDAARTGLIVASIFLLGATVMAISDRPAEWARRWAVRTRMPRIRRFWEVLSSEAHLFHEALGAVARSPLAILGAVVCEIASWTLMISVGPLVLIALGWEGPFFVMFLRILAMFLLIPVSPTPGSAGTAELAFVLISRGIVPSGLVPAAVLLWRLIIYYLPLAVGGALFAWYGFRGRSPGT